MKVGDKVRGSTGIKKDIITGKVREVGSIMGTAVYCLVEWDTEDNLSTIVKEEALEKIWESKKK